MSRRKLVSAVRSRCTITSDGCWMWNLFASHGRYPMATIHGKTGYVRTMLLSDHERPAGHVPGSDCGRALCCNPDHLRWVPKKSSFLSPATRFKLAKASGKITMRDAQRIRQSPHSTLIEKKRLADEYGITVRAIYNIVSYKSWRDPLLEGVFR